MAVVAWPYVCLMVGVLVQLLSAAPAPQNPLESMGVAALSVFSSVAELAEQGGAINKNMGFGNEFFGVHSRTAVGMGRAMRQNGADDSDEDYSEERRKRSPEALDDVLLQRPIAEPVAHSHMHRGKRSPCGGMATQPSETIDEEEAVRRRRAQRQRAAARKKNTTTGKNAKKTTTKKIVEEGDQRQRRRRRQADTDELEKEAQDVTGHVKKFAERVRGVWESFVDGMQGVVERMKETIGAGQNGNAQ